MRTFALLFAHTPKQLRRCNEWASPRSPSDQALAPGRYCLDPVAPCLVFPLMRGGSFTDRLQPAGAKLEHLQRLGLPSPLKPLTWRQKLRTVAPGDTAL